jgi:hypothetical protein
MERDDERAGFRIVPVAAIHRFPVRTPPLHIRQPTLVLHGAVEPAILVQGRVALAKLDEPPDEGDARRVGRRPVDPRQRAVLRVTVVVALLRAAELVAHREHRRSPRHEQRGEQVPHVAAARFDDGRIVARTLHAVVPRMIDVAAVAIVFAVGGVVLLDVGNEVREREAIVRRDEVDRPRRGRRRAANTSAEPASRVARSPICPGLPRQYFRAVSR